MLVGKKNLEVRPIAVNKVCLYTYVCAGRYITAGIVNRARSLSEYCTRILMPSSFSVPETTK